MTIKAIIPVFNEEKTVQETIKGTIPFVDLLVIIDDGSTDNTVKIVQRIKSEKLKIYSKVRNQGKGEATKLGIRKANVKNNDIVLFLDGDGEHNPLAIPMLLKELNDYDLVLGKRHTIKTTFLRIIGNNLSNFWFKLLNSGIEDSQTGFRAIKGKLLNKLALRSSGFEIDIEILLECVFYNAKICSVDLPRVLKTRSHLNLVDSIKINVFFEKWVLKYISRIKIGFFKKIFLIVSAYAGLILFTFLKALLNIQK